MKTTCSLVALAALSAAPSLFSADPSVRLERDVPVALRLKQALSSETARVNDRVEFEVMEDVGAAGTVVIPKGSSAWGRVVDAAPVGRLMRSGRLAVDIESVSLAGGASVRLRAAAAAHPGVAKSHEIASDGLGALPALPFTMFKYGKAIQIPAGKLVTVYTAAPVALGSTPQSPEVLVRSAAPLQPPATFASVLPPVNVAPPATASTGVRLGVNAAPAAAVAANRSGPPPPVNAAPPATASTGVLPGVNAAPAAAVAANRSASPPPVNAAPAATDSTGVLPGVNAAPAKAPPADGIARASLPGREPASVSRGGSKKLLTILAVGAAAGLAGGLAAKGRGGAQTAASAPGATPTTVGIGQITVGGPH